MFFIGHADKEDHESPSASPSPPPDPNYDDNTDNSDNVDGGSSIYGAYKGRKQHGAVGYDEIVLVVVEIVGAPMEVDTLSHEERLKIADSL
ncbi:hypothetical protein DFQ26_009493 [Actinomortierella ambigua]|nr:hypothetical protein DFQ26_009493 [Actinomortierella ambigua]